MVQASALFLWKPVSRIQIVIIRIRLLPSEKYYSADTQYGLIKEGDLVLVDYLIDNRVVMAAGTTPNFEQVMAYLKSKQISQLQVNLGWAVHYLNSGQYLKASNVIDQTSEEDLNNILYWVNWINL